MPVAHQPLATVVGQLVGMHAEQGRNLGFDGLSQQRSRAVAQHLGQRISRSSWLRELEKTLVSVTAYHSFGREVEASSTPTIRRLTPSCRHQLSPIARVGVYGAIAVSACRITRSIRVKAAALGIQWKNGYRQQQRCKNEARHRIPPLLFGALR